MSPLHHLWDLSSPLAPFTLFWVVTDHWLLPFCSYIRLNLSHCKTTLASLLVTSLSLPRPLPPLNFRGSPATFAGLTPALPHPWSAQQQKAVSPRFTGHAPGSVISAGLPAAASCSPGETLHLLLQPSHRLPLCPPVLLPGCFPGSLFSFHL